MPEPTYLIFSSVTSFADFDKMLASGEATMKAPRPRDELRAEGSARLGSGLLGAEEADGQAGPKPTTN